MRSFSPVIASAAKQSILAPGGGGDAGLPRPLRGLAMTAGGRASGAEEQKFFAELFFKKATAYLLR
jgi:hypothetical protein